MLRAVGKLFAPWGKNRKSVGEGRKERQREIGWVRCDLGGKNRLSAKRLRHIAGFLVLGYRKLSAWHHVQGQKEEREKEDGKRDFMGAGGRTRERGRAVGIENAGIR